MPSSPFDARLSARLNDVPLPDGLLGRLRRIPLASDGDFDRALADIALPTNLTERLAAIASVPCRPWASVVTRAAAAVALFAVGLGYVFSVTALVYSRFDQPLLAGEALRSAWHTVSGAAAADEMWVTLNAEVESPLDSLGERRSPAVGPLEEDGTLAVREGALVGEPVALAKFDDSAIGSVIRSSEPATDQLGAWSIERASVRVVGESHADLSVSKQTGVLPWLETAGHPTAAVALRADNASYRYCRREIASGRFPPNGFVRAEEFLAEFAGGVVDRGLIDGRSGTPAIGVAAAPSPYGGPLADTLTSQTDRRWLVAVGVWAPGEGNADEPSDLSGAPLVTLHFVPERVKAYRIVGYGLASPAGGLASPVGGGPKLAPPPVTAAGSERPAAFERTPAVLLFEMELTDAEPSPAPLGEVRLTWHDARGEVQAVEAALTRRSFADHFDAAPPGWRQAALVGLAAESLAGSPFAEYVSLADVAELARRIEPLVDDPAGWREFIEMTGKAQQVRIMSESIGRAPVQKFLASRVLSL